MEGSNFDRLARAISRAGSRRQLLGIFSSIRLGALLSQLDNESAEARRKHGRNRGHNPGKHKHKRNRKGKRKGSKGSDQCGDTGSLCEQDSDCCTHNCFNFICAARVTVCGSEDAARQCVPPAKGCAGGKCCYGAAGCGDACCELPANQCNPQDECCVPNCDGRQCGPDGCGTGGTCGSCHSGQTCHDESGQCVATCSAQNCPHGCCDAQGKCQTGTTAQACGKDGETCQACASGETCLDRVCRNVAGTCTTTSETCGNDLNSPCNSNDFCTCDMTIDGAKVCRFKEVDQCGISCNSHDDCGPDKLCVPCFGCNPTAKACASLCST